MHAQCGVTVMWKYVRSNQMISDKLKPREKRPFGVLRSNKRKIVRCISLCVLSLSRGTFVISTQLNLKTSHLKITEKCHLTVKQSFSIKQRVFVLNDYDQIKYKKTRIITGVIIMQL